ncbi:cubilin-like isoform X2 [Cimex lectularius]|uniref:Cubilin n=1 Tax=Cimex lectularius TaxID=79782 RepID=A0A8I6RKQ8_CIMLE|nr:cubilin-like isoform X2 [Cimex lectularius]
MPSHFCFILWQPSFFRPIIIGEHRTIKVIGAKDRDIYLTSNKGYITANDEDIGEILDSAESAFALLRNINNYKTNLIEPKLKEIQDTFATHLQKFTFFEELFGSPANKSSLAANTRILAKRYERIIERLTKSVDAMRNKYSNITSTLSINECNFSPCNNGGTCLDGINGTFCLCPNNWEGKFCNADVNECEKFHGTDLGCQNGATCINLPGSYRCNCSDGFFGVTCTKKTYNCTKENSAALCGHGFCYNQGGNSTGFVCKCDQGWGKNSTKESDPCTEDIDECALASPCSHDPLVACENTVGGYKCKSCPEGYSGNGHQCADINECEINNGGCSINPKVECINLRGTSMCQACPSGYSGDGKTCTFVPNLCLVNNGGCNQDATCIHSTGMSEVLCRCPFGYIGTGKGTNGCMEKLSSIDRCSLKPCQNGGSCVPAADKDDYTCFCPPKFIGKNCSETHDSCFTRPCLNGGSCEIVMKNSFRCHCSPGFSGHHCEFEENDCVETFTTLNGTLSRKLTYSHNVGQKLCRWTIKTEFGKVLSIKFLTLKFPEKCQDRKDPMVKLYDGMLLLHEYCGTILPKLFTSSNNIVVIEAGGFLAEDVEFSLTWTTVETSCGDHYLTATKEGATLKSPGYPGLYPKNLNCVWVINAELGKRIKFTVYTLDIKSDENCNQDYLQFTEDSTQAVLARLCNSNIPRPIVSSWHKASVLFYTNNIPFYEGKGFHLFYQQIDGPLNKGSTLKDPEGNISFTSFDLETMPYFYFMWKLDMPEDIKIILEFNKFSIENCTSSKPENLEVYDGPDTDAPLIGRWCGNISALSFKSSSNTLAIIFKGSNLSNKSNFDIGYTTVCERVIKEANGTIKFNYFPYKFFTKTCYFTIQSPPGYRIILYVTTEPNKFVKIKSPMQIFDGSSSEFPVLETFVNSITTNKVITSSLNVLFLKYFIRDFHQKSPVITYTSVPLECGYITTKLQGMINLKQRNPKTCLFIIIAPPNYVIHLSTYLHNFNLDGSYLKIYQDIPSNAKNKYKKYINEGPNIVSSSNKIAIESTPFTTFEAAYESIAEDSICRKTLITSVGSIVSPNYPQNYPNGYKCDWVIDVAEGTRIRLIIHDFALENSESCRNDYLKIRNGGTRYSPVIGKYCSKQYPKEIHSQANAVYLSFKTNHAVTGKGFKLSWDLLSSDCGGHFNSSSGVIDVTSVKYCMWKISTSGGNSIQLNIINKNLACGNYIIVHDSKGARKTIGVCNLEKWDISDNNIVIEYRAQIGFHFYGSMQIIYQTVCNRTISGFPFGVIESPNFPSSYGLEENCMWTLVAPLGNTIKMRVSHFTMEYKTTGVNNCSHNYLEITEGTEDNQPTGMLLKRHCSGNDIPLIDSHVNRVFVNFVTSSDIGKSGFRMEWEVSGCGEVFRNKESGEIASPGYPHAYNKSIVCEWFISVPLYKTIVFTIDDMNLDNYENCTHDYLKIYGGKNDQAHLVSNVCHSKIQSPIVVSSLNNYAFVRFNGTAVNRFKGFHATFTTKEGCVAMYSASSGSFHSLNYPNGYNNISRCEYIITTSETSRINLTFTNLNIQNCMLSFIEIFDSDRNLGQFCYEDKPPLNLVSTGNKLRIVYFAREIKPLFGFVASYTTICGGKITTYQGGTLQSREANPVDSKSDSVCTWTIYSENNRKKIILTFTTLHLKTSTEMTYINIFAGDNTSSTLLVKTLHDNELPPPIILSTNKVTIEFKEKHYAYFTLDYSFLDTACGGNFTSDKGQIVSPNFPDNYPRNSECIWTINVSPGNELIYQFSMIQFEKPDCNEEYIEIRENNWEGKLLGLFCNNTLPASFRSKTSIWIMFKSAENGSGKGFKMDYILNNEIVLYGSSGEIANPHNPNFYSSSKTFTWKIITDDDSVIHFEIKNFNLLLSPDEDPSEYCLKFYNGFSTSDPVLKVVCEEEPQFTSTTKVVLISIKPHKSRFFLSWQQLDKKYNPNISKNKSGTCNTRIYLTTKNSTYKFGRSAMSELKCEWIFETDPQNHIVIRFNSIKFEGPSGRCDADINIYNLDDGVDRNDEKIATLCHDSDILLPFRSGKVAKVVYKVKNYWVFVKEVGFSATATIECGGRLTSPQGIISYAKILNSPTAKFHQPVASCQWNITVKQGHTIKIHFKKIEFSDHSCSKSHLMIRNGGYSDSPLLGQGKYCEPVEVPETNSNRAYILLNIITFEDELEMELSYKTVSHRCGNENILLTGDNDVSAVTISSPNYPNVPPAHIECKWIVFTDRGKSISFHLTERINMAYDNECHFEYLELREGSSELGTLIGRYCSQQPPTIQTEGNALFIKYFTGIDNPNDGFTASISLSTCGGTIFETSYKIDSNELKTHNRNCTWLLRGEPGESYNLVLSGLKKDMPYSIKKQPLFTIKNELYDHNMYLYSSDDESKYELEISRCRITYNSGEGKIPDFSIELSKKVTKCRHNLLFNEGSIVSPGYTFQGWNIYCQWKIKGQFGKKVKLTFSDFNLPSSKSDQNSVKFYNVDGEIIKVLNGIQPNGTTVESTSNIMFISYTCKRCSLYHGFKAYYTTFEPAPCSKYIEGEVGSVESQLASSVPSFECLWQYTKKNSSGTVVFSFNNTINPEYEKNHRIKIIVYTGDIKILARSDDISSKFPVTVFVPYNEAKILVQGSYKENSPLVDVKLRISWRLNACGGVLENENNLVIPRLPIEQPFPYDCVWVLQHSLQPVKIVLTELLFEDSCDDNYLEVRNGATGMAVSLGKYCGKQNTHTFGTSAKYTWVHFYTTAKKSKQIFNITVLPSSGDCGDLIEGENGTIISPNYPNSYSNNSECEWIIIVKRDSHIVANLVNGFQLEESPLCKNDFVEFFDYVDSQWVSLGRQCGRGVGIQKSSSSHKMKILFRTNENISGRGFKLEWKTSCGGLLYAQSDVEYITSPGYPDNYFKNLTCNYTIISPGNYIKAHFEAFHLQDETHFICTTDYIRIIANLKNKKINSKYCGQNIPPDFMAKDAFNVIFKTNNAKEFPGFFLQYYTYDCGGNLTSPKSLTFSSEAKCDWNVIAPDSAIVAVRIWSMGLTVSSECSMEYIKIWDGGVSSKNKTNLATLCGNVKSEVFETKTKEAVIELDKRTKNSTVGIDVFFVEAPSRACGGPMTLGKSFNLTINSTLPLQCDWYITAPRGNILIKYLNFSVSSPSASPICIEIHDNLNRKDEPLIETCSPIYDTTVQSVIRIILRAKPNTNATLYSHITSFHDVCGVTLLNITDQPTTLTSPNYPAAYPANLHCIWRLITNSKIIQIRSNNVDIEETELCEADYLEIEDVGNSNIDKNPKPIFCGNESINYYSSTAIVLISFNSNSEVSNSGFNLTIMSKFCKDNYTSQQGRVNIVYGSCNIEIYTPPKTFISIHFREINLPSGDCDTSSITVLSGKNLTELKKICGHNAPNMPIFSPHNFVVVQTKVNKRAVQQPIFDLSYTSTDKGQGCGGKLVGSAGAFTSPFYPGNMKNLSCKWLIEVPVNTVPQITFKAFGLSLNSCQTDYLQLFDIINENQQFRVKYCGDDEPALFTGRTNKVLLVYETTFNYGGIGFSATFESTRPIKENLVKLVIR